MSAQGEGQALTDGERVEAAAVFERVHELASLAWRAVGSGTPDVQRTLEDTEEMAAELAKLRESLRGVRSPAEPVRRPYYANLGVTDDEVARGEDFGKYDFPNLGSPGPGPDRDGYREW